MKCIWNWMVGVVHTEETNRHSQSVKYQSLLKKHIAETPLFVRLKSLLPLAWMTWLLYFQIPTDGPLGLFLTLISQCSQYCWTPRFQAEWQHHHCGVDRCSVSSFSAVGGGLQCTDPLFPLPFGRAQCLAALITCQLTKTHWVFQPRSCIKIISSVSFVSVPHPFSWGKSNP